MTNQIAVLVVEDEPLIRMDVGLRLEEAGFVVFEAANAEQAIAHLKAQPTIRVMFTDIQMPGGMDGLELAAAVRDRWPPVKIIVTSSRQTVKDDYLPDGSAFIAKPYRHDSFMTAIRQMLV